MTENETPKKTMTFEAEHEGIRYELVLGFDAGGVFRLLHAKQITEPESNEVHEAAHQANGRD